MSKCEHEFVKMGVEIANKGWIAPQGYCYWVVKCRKCGKQEITDELFCLTEQEKKDMADRYKQKLEENETEPIKEIKQNEIIKQKITEQYQILISFNKKVAEYGKPTSDLIYAQRKANKLLSSLQAKSNFKISVIVEKIKGDIKSE